MEVDEAPRPGGRFNLDRAAQEHMNEGLEVWIPPEPLPSVHSLDAQSVRPLMEVKLPGYTPSSTASSSQAGSGSSRLKALQERLLSKTQDDSVKEGRPPTWRDHPVRNVTIASYKKNKDGAYHRHNRMDWTAAQRARRDCFHDASSAEYFAQPRIPDVAVHLIIGDSLIRVLTRVQSHWQVGVLSLSAAATPQMLASLEMLDMVKMYTVTLTMGTNDVSRGESRKVMKLHEKMSCFLQELRIWFDPAILTICTVPYNMMFDQHAMEMNEKVRNINGEIRQIQQRSVLPVRLLDVADLMEQSLPRDASSDGIHFDTPKGTEWLNGVFQRHINQLESHLIEMAQFTLGPPPIPPFYVSRSLSSRLGARASSRDSSRSSGIRQPGSTPMEAEEAESFTPQSSLVSSVVVLDDKRMERTAEANKTRYSERIKELDLEDLECREELAEVLGLKDVSHEDLSRHHCVDWLKAHEAHFSRAKTMEAADLTGIPLKSAMGPIKEDGTDRPLKQLGSPGLIVEPAKHRTSVARKRVATPAQYRVVEKLLEPGDMGLPDAAYEGARLVDDP